ncbi:unnamed protein product [Nippostrongylus brasiliensis]|uniref:DnaJ homolog dnj-5 (inferred by orthology to a C. elegans protein) n=1 Tax=Nippostrongylus brasiliensis TaxID=27835 RepID=A0A0N4YE80_NIPBR|nr:unnamed protein product [Nippostrongylus brasiliensis]
MRRLLRFHEPESLIWGLEENMLLPTTGEEALERFLLMPRCQDAYGVLGLKASCTEEDVRRHFKRLNSLLNPNKNMLEGAEEAHELVMKAYQAISTPESRKAYNFTRIHPYKNVLHHEIGELWDRIRDRVEEARNSMYCDCGRRHLRVAVDIRQNEARYCRRCKVRHPARSNDIWVESRLFGLLWVYFTCCDGVVYDITEWATCEVNYLKHVRPNSHTVQYRLAMPKSRICRWNREMKTALDVQRIDARKSGVRIRLEQFSSLGLLQTPQGMGLPALDQSPSNPLRTTTRPFDAIVESMRRRCFDSFVDKALFRAFYTAIEATSQVFGLIWSLENTSIVRTFP